MIFPTNVNRQYSVKMGLNALQKYRPLSAFAVRQMTRCASCLLSCIKPAFVSSFFSNSHYYYNPYNIVATHIL